MTIGELKNEIKDIPNDYKVYYYNYERLYLGNVDWIEVHDKEKWVILGETKEEI